MTTAILESLKTERDSNQNCCLAHVSHQQHSSGIFKNTGGTHDILCTGERSTKEGRSFNAVCLGLFLSEALREGQHRTRSLRDAALAAGNKTVVGVEGREEEITNTGSEVLAYVHAGCRQTKGLGRQPSALKRYFTSIICVNSI